MPRRTAWASQSELAELYDLIYAPHADHQSRQKALSRMSVYLSSPSCPSFIHLLHSLLSADLLSASGTRAEVQSTRLSCAMAVVRFINGMVDPLQTGPYARPISHIAASLKIPQSLIAIRHRATHEDLPPLPLLKQAVHSAIEYINHYSLLPSLASTSSDPFHRTSRAETLVGRWKKLIKSRVKGESSSTEADRDERRLKREFDDEDAGEVAEALATVGGLVPLAKKKRPSLQAAEPTKASMQIWTPLIDHLALADDHFVDKLVDRLFYVVRGRNTSGSQGKDGESNSARWSAAVWILWLWSDRNGSPRVGEAAKRQIRREIMSALIEGNAIIERLSEELSEMDPVLEDALSGLNDVLAKSEFGIAEEGGLSGLEVADDTAMDVDDDVLAQMEARLAQLASRKSAVPERPEVRHEAADHSTSFNKDRPTAGWTRLDHTRWKPCPIGSWGQSIGAAA